MALAAIQLDAVDLAVAGALLLANAAVILALRLGLERTLVVAGARATLQLLLLGLVLEWIFRQQGFWPVLGMMTAMAVVAGLEAVRRTSRRVKGAYAASVGVMLVTSFAVTFYGLSAVIDLEGPWYSPQYSIPILGMVLGNTLNGVSIGLDTALEGFVRDRERVELLLAHGASRAEAARDVTRRAIRTGMIPILNAMTTVGVVSIPGMMTGQILAGEDPSSAARYQIFILFSIAAGVAVGTVGVVLAASRLVFDDRDRLRADRIRPAAGAPR